MSGNIKTPRTPKKKSTPNYGSVPRLRQNSNLTFDDLNYDDKIKTIAKRRGNKETIILGQYQLSKKVGKGAFGVVYKAIDIESKSYVAIKRMYKEEIDENTLYNLKSEIDLLRKLDHPNIVKYVGLVDSDNHVNLILEYIESGSLLHIIKQYGEMPESLSAIYTGQMLKGLDYLHKQNVIHRDIKASNILITGDGVIKLADFGIATTENGEDSESQLEGSPYWLAPETILLSPPSTACDIWGLGCTIIEILTGTPPFFDMPTMSALFHIVQDPHPPLPEKITSECSKFLMDCFQKEPENRPTAEKLSKHPWILKYATSKKDSPSISRSGGSEESLKKITLEEAKRTVREHNACAKNRVGLLDIDWRRSSEDSNSTSTSNYSPSTERADRKSSGGDDDMTPESSDCSEGMGTWKEKAPKSPRIMELANKLENLQHNGSVQYVVLIPGFETRRNKLVSYTVYRLKISFGTESWTVFKTYTDFKDFHKNLTTKLRKVRNKLPSLPPSRMWGADRVSFVKKRRGKLQTYLEFLVKIHEVTQSGILTNFLKEDGRDAQKLDQNSGAANEVLSMDCLDVPLNSPTRQTSVSVSMLNPPRLKTPRGVRAGRTESG